MSHSVLPSFSVVVATYNRRDLVLGAIDSVMKQTYPAFEVIVVVDGSSDNTADAVRREYPAATVYEQANLGPSIAHNTGISLATGDYVCFLDDDDLWHRDKLMETAFYIRDNSGCLAVRNPVWYFSDRDGPDTGFGMRRNFYASTLQECEDAAALADASVNSFEYLEITGRSFDLMRERNRGVLSATVVERRTLIRAGGFCPMQTCGDDWTMFTNVARLTEWHTIPIRLGYTRLHKGQNTEDPRNGMFTLAGKVNAWYTGRPSKTRNLGCAISDELVLYAPVYRKEVAFYLWVALRSAQFRMANAIWRLGCLLLPRWGDRFYAMLPPQLTWRFERYVLGQHK